MNEIKVKQYYDEDNQIRAYINAYAVSRNISVDEAMKHEMVKEYIRWIIQAE